MRRHFRNTMLFAAALLMLVGTSQAQTQRGLGLRPTPGTLPRLGFQYNLIPGRGLQVLSVWRGSLADQMGLEQGDLIVSFNGQSVAYPGAYDQAMLNATRFGGNVNLGIQDVRTGMIQYRSTNVFGPAPYPYIGNPQPVFNPQPGLRPGLRPQPGLNPLSNSGPYYVPQVRLGR